MMLVSYCNLIYDNLVSIYSLPISRSVKPWFIPSIFSPCRMSDTPFSRLTRKQFFLFTFDGDFVFIRVRDKNSYCYFKSLTKELFSFGEVKNDSKK